jgi:hypothetical protein
MAMRRASPVPSPIGPQRLQATESATLSKLPEWGETVRILDDDEASPALPTGPQDLGKPGNRTGGPGRSVATPVISMEVTVLDDWEDVFVHRDADALTVARALMLTVLTRFNLVWRVRRGDCPRGRRLAPPWLRAWDDPGERDWRIARQRPVRFDGPLTHIDDVCAAVLALCAYRVSAEELVAVKAVWPRYRFSRVIRAKRLAVARVDRL